MKSLKIFALMAMVCVLLAGSANAGLITTTSNTVGPTTTDFPFTLTFGATALPGGNHFVSATLELFATINDTTLTLNNTATGPQTFKFIGTTEADVITNSVDSTFVGSATTPTTVLNTGFVTFASGETRTYAPITINETLGATSVGAAYLSGGVLTGATATFTSFSGGGGNIKVTQVQDATIYGTLIFTYAPDQQGTPEPATMALLGSALVGLGVIGRKRFAR
jgi:hypothetical protein